MRVLVAARLSQLQKDGRPGIGIDTQDNRSTAYCEREGHEIVGVVADTKSGTVAPWDRPNLKPWVTDLGKMAQYDAIVAFRNDRLSRGEWADEARIRLWAEEHGKRLIIVDGPQWPPRHDGDKWQWEAMATQARKEWEENRERSMRAQNELVNRGVLVGRPPWGYTSMGEKYNRRMVPTDDGRKYVPQIFQRYVDGQSLREIAEWLTQEGVVPLSGGVWWPRTVWKMLQNPTYIGHRQNSAGMTILRCEALVSTGLWTHVQQTLRESNTGRGPVNPESRSLLTPLCPSHDSRPGHAFGSPMYRIRPQQRYRVQGETSYGPGKIDYYRCAGKGAMRRGCGNMVHLSKVDELVTEFLTQLDSPIYEQQIIPGTNHDDALATVEFELKSLASQGLNEDDEDARRAELRAERKRLMTLDPTPDRVELVDTGRTYGEEWSALSAPERRLWLASRGVRCYAAKTSDGTVQAAWPTLLLDAMGAGALLEGDGISVALTWLGSGIYE